MNFKFPLLALILSLLASCDVVTDYYPTRADAEKAHLFQRGWLPDILPISSKAITTANDLDINISKGDFAFDPKEAISFISKLSSYSGSKPPLVHWTEYVEKMKKKGYIPYEYTEDDSKWIFIVNSKIGHARYIMWLERKADNK